MRAPNPSWSRSGFAWGYAARVAQLEVLYKDALRARAAGSAQHVVVFVQDWVLVLGYTIDVSRKINTLTSTRCETVADASPCPTYGLHRKPG